MQISALAILFVFAFSKMLWMSDKSKVRFDTSLFSQDNLMELSRPYSAQRFPARSLSNSSSAVQVWIKLHFQRRIFSSYDRAVTEKRAGQNSISTSSAAIRLLAVTSYDAEL
jgi:hypothetical protein